MFSKKPHTDIKKSMYKVLDVKKDSLSRLKHLRLVLDNSDLYEAKLFFETNYSHIYYIFYDVFITIEANLKQRVHKAHKEELDAVRYILEKILTLIPELLNKKWQLHSLQRIMKKLLHPGNASKLRKEGMRLFLLWYQILNDNAPDDLDVMFMALVPGIIPESQIPNSWSNTSYKGFQSQESFSESSVFYASANQDDIGPVYPGEIQALIPSQTSDQLPEDSTHSYLDCLLELMVSQVIRIEWKDKAEGRQQKCFQFLFEKFKRFYLPFIFPQLSWTRSIYRPLLDLPTLRKDDCSVQENKESCFVHKEILLQCQSSVIRWVANFTHHTKKFDNINPPSQMDNKEQADNNSDRQVQDAGTDNDISQSNTSLVSSISLQERDSNISLISNEDHLFLEYAIVKDTFYSTHDNVNLLHEIFRQAFLLPFSHANAMRKVVQVYKDWIYKNVPELPIFMQEPDTDGYTEDQRSTEMIHSHNEMEENEIIGMSFGRLRKDSYIKAILSDLRAGLQNTLQVFIINAANVFLLEISPEKDLLLDEQVDMCKRVLNIYRFMVMNVQMEKKTWEQLLLVLLQITSLVLKERPPIRKDSLGGRLAPALFQTLIVTWIKANLNVIISSDLWDQFLFVLSSLTQWEELIKEWAKTMETLTRVLARHVYNLDLNDLPLQRLSEQKQKKRRGIKNVPNAPGGKRSAFTKLESSKTSDHTIKKKEEKSATPLASAMLDDVSGSDIQAENFNSSGVTRTRSGSGDIRKCSTSPSDRTTISRSASDSHLAYRKKKNHYSSQDSSTASQNQLRTYFVPSITGIPSGIEEEVFRILASAEDYIQEHCSSKGIYHCTKSKSLDYLSQRAESPCLSESSEFRSRSPSPTPSSGLENTSIKDSPMQIEVMVNSSENSCNNSEIGNTLEPKSVMAGGTGRGWLPDVAVVLWRRMLGALGDINKIIDPIIHAQVMEYLVELSDLLIKIRNNLGVTVDNQSSPPPSEFVPPLHIITSWLFEAINLPDEYHQGKILAYKLLCILTLQRQDIPFTRDYLVQFYKTLHYGLVGTNQEIINTIVKYCGPKIFAVGLPGCTLLLLDLIFAANTIASSSEVKGVPRTEALSILGSLLCFPNAYGDMPVLQPTSTDFICMNCTDAKEHVITILLRSGKREPAGLARCISISSLGIFVYEELSHKTSHPRIKEAINILLTAIRFNNKSVAQVSSDMLMLLTDHSDYFLKQYPDIPPKIIELIATTLSSLLPCLESSPSDDDKKLLLSLIFCLGEWCLHLPQKVLTQVNQNNNSLLLSVFKVLNTAVSGKNDIQNTAPMTSMTDLVGPDVDPNIHYDNLKEHIGIANSPKTTSISNMEKSTMESFIKTCTLPMDMKRNSNIIKLAAKVVMSHLVNHLGHFPMGVGAARLTSLVNEADDVPLLARDELSTEVFHAPNIQFFVLNNCSIISFVEIPCMEVPGGGPTSDLITGRSQVRVIVRDLSGKFSWDCSVLYGPPDCKAASILPDQPTMISVNNFLNPRAGPPYHNLSSSSLSLTGMSTSPSCDTLRHRSPHELPTIENSADDLDNLDDLLQYIDHSSPECVLRPGQPLNTPAPLFGEGTSEKEVDTMTVVLNQRNFEMTHNQKHSVDSSTMAKPANLPIQCKNISPFQHCRLLLEQLGFISWEKRPHFDLLKKNEKLLRELRNLDNQKCRETHKIAVIYVAEGQEDKNSLLLNSGGSQAFEEFVAGLGWEIDLETHTGFMGGLQRNKSTGDSAPYYATSFLEVIFHVSTRMPTSADETSITRKLCHLGNDEVHIVWSEHTRDYRRGIIATEFCDVLIVIYPLPNQLYRIQISRKAEIPYFGPLFNGAIIDQKVLSGLVRATAINASRAKRSLIPLYQNFYEERSRSLETIVQNHKDPTTFEQFASSIYCPAPGKMYSFNREIESSIHGTDYYAHGTSNLAAALLDSHGKSSSYSPNIRNRPMSLSSGNYSCEFSNNSTNLHLVDSKT